MATLKVGQEAEAALRSLVQSVVQAFDQQLQGQEDPSLGTWEIGVDGNYRFRKSMRLAFGVRLFEILDSTSEFKLLRQQFENDEVVATHLNKMITCATGGSRLESEQIYASLFAAMIDDNGNCTYREDAFNVEWGRIKQLLESDMLPQVLVMPLKGLTLDSPFQLAEGISLGRLTSEEMGRCVLAGIVRSDVHNFQFIFGHHGGAIRITREYPKLIDGQSASKSAKGFKPSEVVDVPELQSAGLGVLSALRVFKDCQLGYAGWVTWTDAWHLDGMTSFSHAMSKPTRYFAKYELSSPERAEFAELAQRMKDTERAFPFTVRRFNLAFDRDSLEDRLVDLVIAAESLLLSEIGTRDRGEMLFRVSLRAAKLIAHPKYKPRQVYHLMRAAYNVRSSIVHSGKVADDTPLPDDKDAQLPSFTHEIEDIVRLCLRTISGMPGGGADLKKSEFWEGLMFGQSDPNPTPSGPSHS